MNAAPIITNVAMLLVVAAIWHDMKRSGRWSGTPRGFLITAALMTLASLVIHFVQR